MIEWVSENLGCHCWVEPRNLRACCRQSRGSSNIRFGHEQLFGGKQLGILRVQPRLAPFPGYLLFGAVASVHMTSSMCGNRLFKGSPPHICKGYLAKASAETLPYNKLTAIFFFCLASKPDRVMLILGQNL